METSREYEKFLEAVEAFEKECDDAICAPLNEASLNKALGLENGAEHLEKEGRTLIAKGEDAATVACALFIVFLKVGTAHHIASITQYEAGDRGLGSEGVYYCNLLAVQMHYEKADEYCQKSHNPLYNWALEVVGYKQNARNALAAEMTQIYREIREVNRRLVKALAIPRTADRAIMGSSKRTTQALARITAGALLDGTVARRFWAYPVDKYADCLAKGQQTHRDRMLACVLLANGARFQVEDAAGEAGRSAAASAHMCEQALRWLIDAVGILVHIPKDLEHQDRSLAHRVRKFLLESIGLCDGEVDGLSRENEVAFLGVVALRSQLAGIDLSE